jgi:hypothetical protein
MLQHVQVVEIPLIYLKTNAFYNVVSQIKLQSVLIMFALTALLHVNNVKILQIIVLHVKTEHISTIINVLLSVL